MRTWKDGRIRSVEAIAKTRHPDRGQPILMEGTQSQGHGSLRWHWSVDIMSKTNRLREEVRSFLEQTGSANTVEIFDHLNERFRWGATMNQVGNILAKDTRFDKIGHVRGQFRGSTYTVCVWGLRSLEAHAPI